MSAYADLFNHSGGAASSPFADDDVCGVLSLGIPKYKSENEPRRERLLSERGEFMCALQTALMEPHVWGTKYEFADFINHLCNQIKMPFDRS